MCVCEREKERERIAVCICADVYARVGAGTLLYIVCVHA